MDIDTKYLIYGTGAQGLIAADYLSSIKNLDSIFFIDDNLDLKGQIINGIKVIGGMDELRLFDKKTIKIHIAIGHPVIKKNIVDKLKALSIKYFPIVHPSSSISTTAKIGEGLFIGMNSNINTNAFIQDHVIINTDCTVEHDAVIENFCNISPNSVIGGRCIAQEGSFIGSNSTIRARTNIGKYSIIGMGSVVLKDTYENTLNYGNPARYIKRIDENFNWKNVL